MAVAPVTVFGIPWSTASARVLACLIKKDVQFQLVSVDMAKGEHKMPHYLKIQPFGQIPAFQDESITLFESRAISRYICDKYANQGSKGLFGTNLLEKASIDQWLEVEGQSFQTPSLALLSEVFNARMMKLEPDENVIKQNEEKLGKVLDVYENRLGESRFLAGYDFTLADLSHLPKIQCLVHIIDRGDLVLSRKNVGRWWGEISGRGHVKISLIMLLLVVVLVLKLCV